MDAIVVAGLTIGLVSAITAAQQKYFTLIRRYRYGEKRNEANGISILYDGLECDLDIVCVHGLGGNPKTSWTTKVDDKDVNWVQDLLKNDFPRCRIMTYGYNSDRLVPRQFSQTLQAESNQLLGDLQRCRKQKAQERPIIFIAHSFGGLIVKNALAEASEAISENEMSTKLIQLSTVGVLFFGTPQKPRNREAWVNVFQKMIDTVNLGPSDNIAKDYKITRSEARSLSLQLNRYRSIEHGITNIVVIEKTATKMGGREFLVVSHDDVPKSKDMETWIIQPLQTEHRNLVKFNGRHDIGYVLVCKSIGRCLKRVPEAHSRCEDFVSHFKGREISQFEDSKVNLDKESVNDMLSGVPPDVIYAIDASKRGNPTEAEKLFYKELKKLEQEKNASDPAVLEVWDKLAQHYMRIGAYDKAELIYKRLFVSYYGHSDPLSFRAAEAIDGAAQAALEQGRHRSAMRLLTRAKYIYRKAHGKSSSSAAKLELDADARIAILYDELGDHAAAQSLYRSVVEKRSLQLGPSHNETLNVLENLAMSYKMQERQEMAERQLKQVLKLRKAVDEQEHKLGQQMLDEHAEIQSTCSDVGSTVMRLAAVLNDQGKQQETLKLLEQYMEYPGVSQENLQL